MTETAPILRLASIALRRYTRDPDTRQSSSLNLLRYAIQLAAAETSAADAALVAGEAVGELAREARRDRVASESPRRMTAAGNSTISRRADGQ